MVKGGDIYVCKYIKIYICICLRGGGGAQQCGRDILGGGGALENLKDN